MLRLGHLQASDINCSSAPAHTAGHIIIQTQDYEGAHPGGGLVSQTCGSYFPRAVRLRCNYDRARGAAAVIVAIANSRCAEREVKGKALARTLRRQFFGFRL